MAHAAATYAAQLIMVDQPIKHSLVSHTAHVTVALANEAAQTAQACADHWQAAFDGAFSAVLDTEATFEKATILLGDGTDTPSAAVASGPAQAGGSNIQGTSPQVSALLKKITAFAGRKNRGRMYLPFCLDDAGVNQAGLITGDAPGLIQDGCDALLTSLSGFDVPMVICNRAMAIDGATGKPYVVEYQLGAPVTQLVIENYVATQRRRLVRT